MRFLDSNIILDLFGPGGDHVDWSRAQYADALAAGDVLCNLIVVAELTGHASTTEALMERLQRYEIDIVDLTAEAAFTAGGAFREYRRRGGRREAILPDFLIAGHAAALGAALVTRDRRLGSYFNDLALITPETHP